MARPLRIRELLLGAALVSGLVAVPPLLGGGGLNGGSSFDRGDNPVVGSLPCMVDPDLLDMFWLPFEAPKPPPSELVGFPAVLGVIGTPELEDELVDAYGSGNGFVERRHRWACLGLVEDAVVILDRDLVAQGSTELWQYLPVGYVGGNIHISTSSGVEDHPIVGQDVPIPLQAYAAFPEVFSLITLTLTPPAGSSLEPRTIQIELMLGLVSISYLP